MNNPLEERKNLLEEIEYQSTFDYSEISENDVKDLIEFEKDIKTSQTAFVRSTMEIANNLYKAQEKLKSYKTGTFMSWYQNLGFNKDSVSYFLKRRDLSIEYPQKREYIADMPVRVVKELTKKDVDKDLVKEAIQEEVKTTKELKSIQLKYSHGANIETTKVIKSKVEKKEIKQLLKKVFPKDVANKFYEDAVDKLFEEYKLTRR